MTVRQSPSQSRVFMSAAFVIAAAMTLGTSVPHAAAAAQSTADFYVSPAGSDAWSGTLSEPNGAKTDGPFATLERARDAVRESGKTRSGDVVVLLRGGTYRLTQTVVFDRRDSGRGESTVTYAAWPGEQPVLSAGQEIAEWKPLTAELPCLPKESIGNVQVADVSGRFHALFDADGLLPRARSEGFIPLDGGSRNMLHFPASRLRNWTNVDDVEIVTCTFIDELPPGNGRTTEDRRGRGLASSTQADTDHNIYFCAANTELGRQMLDKQQHDGVDAHSLAVDPLFVDPANGDFRLRPDSPALTLSFVPFDMSRVGLRSDRE